MMKRIMHGFADWPLDAQTETLIVGTFNPGPSWVDSDFFYSSPRNYLWTILPTAFEHESLKAKNKIEKVAFSETMRIGFIDLIKEVEVEEGQEANRSDKYIEGRAKWHSLTEHLERLVRLKRVCFTRKTFSGIPLIRGRVQSLAEDLLGRGLELRLLISPARYYSAQKQTEWNNFLRS